MNLDGAAGISEYRSVEVPVARPTTFPSPNEWYLRGRYQPDQLRCRLMSVMRSAWLKWARGVEHQQVLARVTRERLASGVPDRYERCDNAADSDDPFLRMHWHLMEAESIPERWGVLLGDVFTNFRAALDHAMWAAVGQHSGLPERAEDVQFPIVRDSTRMKGPRQKLRVLVAPAVWKVVEEVQPHLLENPQRHQLETLRWMSNVDKHRFVHVATHAFVDVGPVIVRPDLHELQFMDEWRAPGHVEVGDVIAGLTLLRSAEPQGVDLAVTLAHTFELQVGEDPRAWVPLADAMEAVKDYVLAVILNFTELLGEDYPNPESLELGLEHASVAPEFGGRALRWE